MKLSIITINYNNLAGLKKTYDSVVCQTWTDYEWIIIDGGSTDGSKEFVEEHQDKFAYWCSEPDKGVYNAMNKGIAHAKGEYLNFMNSGDCFSVPTILSEVFGLSCGEDILYGYMMRKTIDGDCHNKRSMRNNLSWYDFYFDTLPHQSSFIRRNLFSIVGEYDETYKMLADWKWFAKAVSVHKSRLRFIPKKISIYECGGVSEYGDWQSERDRMRSEIFGSCFSIQDLNNFHDLDLIFEHNWTSFLYKVVRKITKKVYSQ